MARTYRLGKRQQQVDETRGRVVDASHALFSEVGFHHASVEEIALRAGVARATIYHQFGSKLGLFEAVMAEVMSNGVAEKMRKVREHPDAAKALSLYIPEVCRFWSEEYSLFRHLIGVTAIDPDALKLVDQYDGRRRELVVWLVKRLEDQGALRDGMTLRTAVDVIWMLTSFARFDHLFGRSGLSVRGAGQTLSALAATVLADGATTS
jgi:AcrR family transcriptional regulator